jgi:hypothetical protein
VRDEMIHYKGICEIDSLIGAIDDVDMQILSDLDIVRFQCQKHQQISNDGVHSKTMGV